jgi:hypothetical protein
VGVATAIGKYEGEFEKKRYMIFQVYKYVQLVK